MSPLFRLLEKGEPKNGTYFTKYLYWRNQCENLLSHGRPMITARQAECLRVIKDYTELTGFAPTYREISDRMGVATPAGVNCFVAALEERGYISRLPGRARSITLIDFPPHNNA